LPIIFWYSICSAVSPAVEPAALPAEGGHVPDAEEGQQQQQRDQRRLEVDGFHGAHGAG
jgi:hypothetical protein